ncbi:MAG: GTP pyrophosphokinase rsh [Candidatus Heimdallarchaeota archaeon LC_3]|nr:MAG: GTP pyrophosphokinase rsh [Candidatus Heimdallarchaeota archaeon LC_3]
MYSNVNLKLKYEEILKKCETKHWYNSELLEIALEFGKNKHKGQERKISGDPYFIHPIRVAINLIDEPDSDLDLIIAALLHDTVEDTTTTFEEIEKNFGKKTEILVNG